MTRARHVGVLALFVMSLTSQLTGAQSNLPSASRSWLRTDFQRQPGVSTMSSRSGVGKSVASLLLVGIIGYAIWYRTRRARVSGTPAKTHIRIVSGTPVGPKARAVVAEVGGRLILLGVTERSVRKLAWLDAIDDIEPEREKRSDPKPDSANCANLPLVRFQRSNVQESAPRHYQTRPSKFSEVLRDAVGLKTRRITDPALEIAEGTRDRVNVRATENGLPNAPTLIDVEGQAVGLVSRLSRPKS